jgi:hypothetical protein
MYKKMESVIQQLLARAARLIILCNEGDETMEQFEKQGCMLIKVRGSAGRRGRAGHLGARAPLPLPSHRGGAGTSVACALQRPPPHQRVPPLTPTCPQQERPASCALGPQSRRRRRRRCPRPPRRCRP